MSTITRASVAQVPTDFDALFRAAISVGTATVLVADRKVDREQADIRVRADKAITVAGAIRAIELDALGTSAYRVAYPEGITAKMVRDVWGYADPKAIARGPLRDQYLAVQRKQAARG